MKRAILLMICTLSTTFALAEAPQVGDPAPNFALPASDGNTYTLDQFHDRMGVVIAFFPKAFTGG